MIFFICYSFGDCFYANKAGLCRTQGLWVLGVEKIGNDRIEYFILGWKIKEARLRWTEDAQLLVKFPPQSRFDIIKVFPVEFNNNV